MKILFITPQLPFPPRQGTQIRNYHLLKAAATTHQVDLLSFTRPDENIGMDRSIAITRGDNAASVIPSRGQNSSSKLDQTDTDRRQNTSAGSAGSLPARPLAGEPPALPGCRPSANFHDNLSEALDICRTVHTVPVPNRSRTTRLQMLFTSLEPDLAGRLASEEFDAALNSLLNNHRYDIVQVEGLEMARYIPTVVTTAPGTPIVFDDHNVEYLLQVRAAAVDARRISSWPKALYSVIQWLKLKRYERLACRSSKAVLAVSSLDAKALKELGVAVPITVVPNCIDVEYYRRIPGTTRDAATLLFTGTMDYRPNVDAVRWFATEVLPRITTCKPDVRFQIVGRSPTAPVTNLARHHHAVEVVGAVDDILPYFHSATLCVVPIRMAGGARLKILEALAAGLPVVSTSMGAEGIDSVSGEGVLLADTAEEFAASVLGLLDDQELRKKMESAGRHIVEQKYDWKQVAPRLLGVYEAIRGQT